MPLVSAGMSKHSDFMIIIEKCMFVRCKQCKIATFKILFSFVDYLVQLLTLIMNFGSVFFVRLSV